MDRTNKLEVIPVLVVSGAVLMVVGLFMPWITVLRITLDGLQAGGIVALVPVIAVVIAAVYRLVNGRTSKGPAMTMLIASAGALLWAGIGFALLIAEMRSQYGNFGFSLIGIGMGLPIYILGGLLSLGGSIADMSAGKTVRDYGGTTRQRSSPTGGAQRTASTVRAYSPSGGRIEVSNRTTGVFNSLNLPVGQRAIFGRASASPIRIEDPRVSRRHLEVSLDANGWRVRNLSSTNNARFLSTNGAAEKIGDGKNFAYGQVLVGDTILTFHPLSTSPRFT